MRQAGYPLGPGLLLPLCASQACATGGWVGAPFHQTAWEVGQLQVLVSSPCLQEILRIGVCGLVSVRLHYLRTDPLPGSVLRMDVKFLLYPFIFSLLHLRFTFFMALGQMQSL